MYCNKRPIKLSVWRDPKNVVPIPDGSDFKKLSGNDFILGNLGDWSNEAVEWLLGSCLRKDSEGSGLVL